MELDSVSETASDGLSELTEEIQKLKIRNDQMVQILSHLVTTNDDLEIIKMIENNIN